MKTAAAKDGGQNSQTGSFQVVESVDPQMIVESINKLQATLEIDASGKVTYANENFLRISGYSLSDAIGKNHSDFFSEEQTQTEDYRSLTQKLSKGEPFVQELARTSKGDRPFWTVSQFTPYMDKDGKLLGYVEIATDVTALRSELQVRIDIMNTTSVVSEANLRGDIMSVNDKFCELSQYSREELLGRPHNTTRHPDMPREVFKQLWSTIGRGQIFRGIVKNRKKDGNPYYVDAVIAPILGENGKPRKYLGVRYDITETEVERHNMKGILDAIDAAYAYIEFDLTGNIKKTNKNFQATMGFSAEELDGKHHRMFAEPEFASSPKYAQMWEDLRSGKTLSGIFKRIGKGGAVVFIQAVYAPVRDEMGRVQKVIKIATDVTKEQNMIRSVEETVKVLSASSKELTATAKEMSAAAEMTNQESLVAASAAEEVAAGVQTVATNIEEMVASIKEISRSTAESSEMARTTLLRAQQTNKTVTQLGTSSQEIGAVIKVISSIAQQTNLLALNATIEAARAGDAGRGFAVVANEVKELAKQTARATDDITNRIGAIQKDTQNAVEAIGGISEAVDKLNGISGVIAAAVEEQTATTNEVSRVVVEAKKNVESIAATVKAVSKTATNSTAASEQTLASSQNLAGLAEKLASAVSH